MTLQEQISTIKNYLQVLTLRLDELEANQKTREQKYTEDALRFLEITYEKECKAIKNAIMEKSKILNPPNNKWKKITKEQIENYGKEEEEE